MAYRMTPEHMEYIVTNGGSIQCALGGKPVKVGQTYHVVKREFSARAKAAVVREITCEPCEEARVGRGK